MRPGTSNQQRESKESLTERIARELREKALELKQEAIELESAASAIDGKS